MWMLGLLLSCVVHPSQKAPPVAGAPTASRARPGPDDADGDGVVTAMDCDDTNPSAWEAEGVWSGDLKEPAQLASFCAGYCSRSLRGSLILHEVSPKQVSRLSCLREVSGDVKVLSNTSLRTLTGLDGLRTIGGDLHLEDNVALTSLSGLESLEAIGGNLISAHSITLSNLDGLRSLKTVGADVNLFGGWKLQRLDGLSALTQVGGSLHLVDMPALSDLRGLGGLSSLDGLCVQGPSGLRSLDGLSGLKDLRGLVLIEDNARLCDEESAALLDRLGTPPRFVAVRNNAGPCTSTPRP